MKEVYPIEIRQGVTEDGMCIVVLYEPLTDRKVPLIIGYAEAQAISIAREAVPTDRPLTHELMARVLDAYSLEIEEVTIDKLEDGIFYAGLHVTDGITRKRIDARPTDALVLALRAQAPIRIADKVLEEAGTATMEDDMPEEHEPTSEELEAELKACEAAEDYERAAQIMEIIKTMKR